MISQKVQEMVLTFVVLVLVAVNILIDESGALRHFTLSFWSDQSDLNNGKTATGQNLRGGSGEAASPSIAAATAAVASTTATATEATPPPTTKPKFCDYCVWHGGISCIDRAIWLINKGMKPEEAKQLAMEQGQSGCVIK
jgi:hypothetical protein